MVRRVLTSFVLTLGALFLPPINAVAQSDDAAGSFIIDPGTEASIFLLFSDVMADAADHSNVPGLESRMKALKASARRRFGDPTEPFPAAEVPPLIAELRRLFWRADYEGGELEEALAALSGNPLSAPILFRLNFDDFGPAIAQLDQLRQDGTSGFTTRHFLTILHDLGQRGAITHQAVRSWFAHCAGELASRRLHTSRQAADDQAWLWVKQAWLAYMAKDYESAASLARATLDAKPASVHTIEALEVLFSLALRNKDHAQAIALSQQVFDAAQAEPADPIIARAQAAYVRRVMRSTVHIYTAMGEDERAYEMAHTAMAAAERAALSASGQDRPARLLLAHAYGLTATAAAQTGRYGEANSLYKSAYDLMVDLTRLAPSSGGRIYNLVNFARRYVHSLYATTADLTDNKARAAELISMVKARRAALPPPGQSPKPDLESDKEAPQ